MSSAAQQLSTVKRTLQLQRLPHSRTLQAWDAADEYLLHELAAQKDDTPVIVINDNFGALALAASNPVILSWGDSYMAQQATLHNAALNQIPPPPMTGTDHSLQQCLAQLKAEPVRILMRIPKNLAFFSWQLDQLKAFAPTNSELWLAGMDKHLNKNQFELVRNIMGSATFLPGVKKARIWQTTIPAGGQTNASVEMLEPGFKFTLNHNGSAQLFNLQRTPNVFSAAKTDLGAQFFIEQFTQLAPEATSPQAKVADLGCGNGLLSLCYASLYPHTEIIAVDESFQATLCARTNIQQHGLDNRVMTQCTNALESFPDQYFDTILCNPPFHQQMTVGTELAYAMLRTALRTLKPGGQLHLVGNRHLQYNQTLHKLFGNSKTVAGNNKFVVLSARKTLQ